MDSNITWKTDILNKIRGGLIVSCQAYQGEPMRNPETMAQIAQSAEIGGACAIRCQGLSDISLIKSRVNIPVIGLWKEGHEGVYITPTLRHAKACIMAGADIVALDATGRTRPDEKTFEDTIKELKEFSDDILVMADCSCIEDVSRSLKAECDIISTTLAGYVEGQKKSNGPDLELLQRAVHMAGDVPVICEGRIHTLEQAEQAMESGAFAIVVGTAITHPTSLTRWFAETVSR